MPDGMYADVMEKHGFIPANHRAPNEHDKVSLGEIYDNAGQVIPGHVRVLREKDNKTIAVHSDSYALLPDELVFGTFEKALAKSALDLTDMRIGTDYGGGEKRSRTFRQYLLPAHTVEIRPGNPVALRVIMFNSYDGSSGCKGRAGGYSFVCANTSIVGSDIANLSIRHVGDITDDKIDRLVSGLVTAMEQYVGVANDWKRWPEIAVSDDRALEVIAEMPNGSKRLADYLAHAWLRAANGSGPQTGRNLWALYNVLTAWATHGEGDGKSADTRYAREEKVFKMTSSKPFLELKAAA